MTILDRLEGGDLRSDGNANEVAEEVIRHPPVREERYTCNKMRKAR